MIMVMALSLQVIPYGVEEGSLAIPHDIDIASGSFNGTVMVLDDGPPHIQLARSADPDWKDVPYRNALPIIDTRSDLTRIDGTDCHLYFVSYYDPPDRIYRYYLFNETACAWSVLEHGIMENTFINVELVTITGTDNVLIAITLTQGRGMFFSIYYHSNRSISDPGFNVPERLSKRSDALLSPIGQRGEILLWGGRSGIYPNVTHYNDTWLFDPVTGAWKQIQTQNAPSPRYYPSFTNIPGTDKVLLFGGVNESMKNDTYIFDLSEMTWRWVISTVTPEACTYSNMAPLAGTGRVLLYGGFDGKNDLSQSYEFFSNDNTWRSAPTNYHLGPTSRHFMSGSHKEGSALLLGRIDGQSTFAMYSTVRYGSIGNFTTDPVRIEGSTRVTAVEWDALEPDGTYIGFVMKSAPTKEDLLAQEFIGPGMNRYYDNRTRKINIDINETLFIQLRFHLETNSSVVTPELLNIRIITNHAPEIDTITPLTGASINTTHIHFEWKYADRDGDPQSAVEIEYGRSWHPFVPLITMYLNISDYEMMMNASNMDEGGWFWRMRAMDDGGEWSSFSAVSYFFIDTRPPSSSITYPSEGRYYRSVTEIRGKSSDADPESGIDSVWVRIKNEDTGESLGETGWGADPVFLRANGTYFWSLLIPIRLEDGVYSAWSHCIDGGGNREINSSWTTFTIDCSSPIDLQITINRGETRTDKQIVRLDLSCRDDLSGVHEMSFSFNGSVWEDWIPYDTVHYLRLSDEDGDHTIFFRAKDAMGNVAHPVSASITLNRSGPVETDGPGPDPVHEPINWILIAASILAMVILFGVILMVLYHMGRIDKERFREE